MSQILDDEEMKLIYAQPGLGHTDIELAERFGVGREAIFKWRRKARDSGIEFIQTERGRYRIDSRTFISNIKVSTPESLVLYIAARRLSRNTRLPRQYVQDALEKLAPALYQPMTEKLVKAAAKAPDHPEAEKREAILKELLRSWSERIKVKIYYRGLQSDRTTIHIVSPYLIEPSPWSDSVYLIGHSSVFDDIVDFKIERIERASLTTEAYQIDPKFEEETVFQYVWGIWRSGKKPEMVKLRFSGREVVRRLQESIWHSLQDIEVAPDGRSAIWQAPIAEWQEMLPWVRGWGSDVEVLAPLKLRRRIENEIKRMARIYSATIGESHLKDDPLLPLQSPARLLWAKTDQQHDQGEAIHPLICHLIDVAEMVCALWDTALPQASRRFFADSLQTDEQSARLWLAFLAGLHDLGKASPTFQRLYQPGQAVLSSAGFDFPDSLKAPHGLVSAWALKKLFVMHLGLGGSAAHNLAVAIGGHHGVWPTPREINIELGPGQHGEGIWDEMRATLFVVLAQVLGLADLSRFHLPEDKEGCNVFCMALAGLISAADWLGSMAAFFSFAPGQVYLNEYAQEAFQQALQALAQLGWSSWSPPQEGRSFSELFSFPARPLQQAAVSLSEQENLEPPALVIIEAPTGEGKTEAAWYLADHWLSRYQQRGVYVAMPTQATSNQMLRRVRTFIEQRYPAQRTNLILLHGDAAWSEDMRQLRLTAIDEDELGTVGAYAWFLPKKRSLLAPFAVGTVDQALLAAMQTRHFFVRMFGLSHKTVIFDEIHAYDIYMNVSFQRLLRWLAAMGTSVILLSATLPARTRAQLFEAYTGRPFERAVQYPALTWATARQAGQGVMPLAAALPRTVSVGWLAADLIVERLGQLLEGGGCIAFICNTVGQAQAMYRQLDEANLVPPEDLLLFHARFPFYLRQRIEAEVLNRFGKTGERPARSIVIATQVIEQSLDLDFDLIISEMAPIDLILQRIGRLHRHQRLERPAALARPQLLLLKPDLQEDVPQFGLDERIYGPYILLRSYLALQPAATITIPDEVQPLIEAVYGPAEPAQESLSPAWLKALARAKAKLDKEIDEQINAASKNLILPPHHTQLLKRGNKELEEDKPDMHETLQALTRLTRPTITLICLHQTPSGLALDPEGTELITLDDTPDWATTQQLVEQKVTLSNYEVVKHFAQLAPPVSWQKEVNLRHYRPAIFTEGRCQLEAHLALIFDLKRGIIIQKESL